MAFTISREVRHPLVTRCRTGTTTLQDSLHATDRQLAPRQAGLVTPLRRPGSHPTAGVSYRGPWRLPGQDLHLLAEPSSLGAPRKVLPCLGECYLSSEQHADYAGWFETAKRLRELLSELEALGLKVAEADTRFDR
jgi:hypothetical protein